MKLTKMASAVVAGALLAGAWMSGADQKGSSPEVELQAAIHSEMVDGNYKAAIEQYKKAAQTTNRAVAAQALVRMAGCYQKLGDAESRKIYERVLREYGDQKEAAATAQARLNGGAPVKQTNVDVLAKRQLCTQCGDEDADLSSDERLMVFTDWDSGDLAIRDMATGKVKRLMAKAGTWKDSDAFAEGPVFSHDARQIAYFWNRKGQPGQLRVMPNEPGGKARMVVENAEYRYCGPQAWSPDGKSLLVDLIKPDMTRQIATVSVTDGSQRVLKSLDWRYRGIGVHPSFSPDGRYIVYHALTINPSQFTAVAADFKDQHIYVLATDGSVETEVVKAAGINQHPVWAPDGKHLLFISDRLGRTDLWSVAVENGKAIGPESLVSSQIGKVSSARLRGNSYYYTSHFHTEYVNIAESAPRGDNQSRLIHATESFIGVGPTWSPDGKSIGFKRHHQGTANEYDLVVRSLETGNERTYLTNLGTSGGNGPAWLHDGKAVMTGILKKTKHEQEPGDLYSPHRVDLTTGEFTAVPHGGRSSGLSADGKTQYATQQDAKNWDKSPLRIVAVDLSSGQQRLIFTLPEAGYAWAWATWDGRTFVIRRQDPKTKIIHFYRLDIDGTGYREIYAIAPKEFRNIFTLTKDGRWLVLAKRSNGEKNWQLVRIPIDGGAPEATGVELEDSLSSMDLSPDGSRIAYTTSKSVAELWTLDNVLSVLK
jgi:Tol biopolymer transport system component